MRKLFFVILILIISVKLYSQEQKIIDKINESKKELIDYNSELKKIQEDNVTLKNTTLKLLKTNDSILIVIKGQNKESYLSQKKLYENNFALIGNALTDIENTEKQIVNYRTLLAVAHSGTLISNLNSPTNSELGVSFSEIVIENSKSILSEDLRGKSKNNFVLTIQRIVKIPIINSALNSNPITSLVTSVFQQAVGYKENKISENTIIEFNESLQPYIEFYDKIDSETNLFKANIVSYKFELSTKESKLKQYKELISKTLKGNEKSPKDVLLIHFKKNIEQFLKLEDYIQINNSSEIIEAIKLINKTQNLEIDQDSFKKSNKEYILKIVEILKNSKNTKFNNYKIANFIQALEATEKEIK